MFLMEQLMTKTNLYFQECTSNLIYRIILITFRASIFALF